MSLLLNAIIISCVIISITGFIEVAVGSDERIFVTPSILDEFNTIDRDKTYVRGGRVEGVMRNPGIYGAILGMGMLISLCCLVHEEKKSTKNALIAATVMFVFGIFLSYTRSAWLSTLCAVFLAQFLIKDLWKKTLPIMIIFVLIFLFITYGSILDNSLFKIRTFNIETIDFRIKLFNLAWVRFLEKPFFGWGNESYQNFSLTRFGESSHSIFLTFMVDGGLVLLLTFLFVIVYLFREGFTTFKTLGEEYRFEKSVLGAMLGCILIYLITGLFLELRSFSYFNAVFWICASVINRLGIGYEKQVDNGSYAFKYSLSQTGE